MAWKLTPSKLTLVCQSSATGIRPSNLIAGLSSFTFARLALRAQSAGLHQPVFYVYEPVLCGLYLGFVVTVKTRQVVHTDASAPLSHCSFSHYPVHAKRA